MPNETTTHWRTLPAGAELDALVAVIMEPPDTLPVITAHEARLRTWGPDPKAWVWFSWHMIDSPGGWWQAQIGSDHGASSADHEPVRWRPSIDREPSTDIAVAWQVVEAVCARGFHAVVKTPFEDGDPYHAGFTPKGMTGWNGMPDHRGGGDTAPLAICRASLAAVEAKDA